MAGARSRGSCRQVEGVTQILGPPPHEYCNSAAVERLAAARDQAVVERALEEARGGSRGATGLQETMEALSEGRVDHLAFDPAIGDPAELLVRGAFAGGAGVTVAHDGVAELLEPADGVAAILRY